MKRIPGILLLLFLGMPVCAQSALSNGEIKGPFVWKSTIYPATERNYWLYIPAQYDPAKPACLMVVQDGLSRARGWNLMAVLDSLIDKKLVPVTIGLFVDHGTVAPSREGYNPRFNRSFEYDALGDRYARFLVEELIPHVAQEYNISSDPNDRSIAGASSGAICAFNAAWERPDQFRRVLSTIGTYVGLRGGDSFVTLVRKSEPRPIRIFLQDGTNDLNIYGGDWWMANQSMLSALTYAGYEVAHAWGEGGGHDSKHASTIMAEALVWLWKDYPEPVKTHLNTTARINVMLENEQWQEIKTTGAPVQQLAVGPRGTVYYAAGQSVYQVDGNNVTVLADIGGQTGGIAVAADGNLYAGDLTHRKIVSIDGAGHVRDVLKGKDAVHLEAIPSGLYVANLDGIECLNLQTKKTTIVHSGQVVAGMALSADHNFLNVTSPGEAFGYSFRALPSGELDAGQPYVHLHAPYGHTSPGASGMAVDRNNLLYTATAMGVQVSDQLGRVNFIFRTPEEAASDVKLGGNNFDILYLVCDGRLFKRRINAVGTYGWAPAVQPPKPGL